jgi:hypothetical protein
MPPPPILIRPLIKKADLYLFALTDAALYDLEKYFSLGNKLVLHTAGSVSKDVLSKISENYGVLYPLQSLRKDLPELPSIPFLVDANTTSNLQIIESLALELDPLVQRCDDDKRMKTHVAAVFINNFTNHLYAQSEDFCKKENIDFGYFKALVNGNRYPNPDSFSPGCTHRPGCPKRHFYPSKTFASTVQSPETEIPLHEINRQYHH